MNIFFISPTGNKSPYLFDTFIDTFVSRGHTITTNINEATVIFFDSHAGYLPYDWNVLNVALDNKLPCVYFDAFDYHGDSSENWFGFNNWENLEPTQDWSKFIYHAKDLCKPLIYFMRKMQFNAHYGDFVHPMDGVLYEDHIFPTVSKEELFNRPIDICFIGNTSKVRRCVTNYLETSKEFKTDFYFPTERIPHEEWLNRHRQSKFFLELDGGGIGSDRPYQLITISPMIVNSNKLKAVTNFYDGEDCLLISPLVSSGSIIKIKRALSDADALYKIYTNGIAKMKTYFSYEYRADYILDILSEYNLCLSA